MISTLSLLAVSVCSSMAVAFFIAVKLRDRARSAESEVARWQQKAQYLEQNIKDYQVHVTDTIARQTKELAGERTQLFAEFLHLETVVQQGGGQYQGLSVVSDSTPPFELKNSGLRNLGFDVPKNSQSKVQEICHSIRQKMYSFTPIHMEHLGGTVQTIQDCINWLEICVDRFAVTNSFKMNFVDMSDGSIDKDQFLYHDLDFFLRWYNFMSLYLKNNVPSGYEAPRIELDFKQRSDSLCSVSVSLVIRASNLFEEDFNDRYKDFFFSGELPEGWEFLNQYLLSALKMCSLFHVNVEAHEDDFGNTVFKIFRDCYVTKDLAIFARTRDLRSRYKASEYAYISPDTASYEENHFIDLFDEMAVSYITVPIHDWSPSLISRTRTVVVSGDFTCDERNKIIESILACPFVKVKIIVLRHDDEPLLRDERVTQIESPLSKEKILSAI